VSAVAVTSCTLCDNFVFRPGLTISFSSLIRSDLVGVFDLIVLSLISCDLTDRRTVRGAAFDDNDKYNIDNNGFAARWFY